MTRNEVEKNTAWWVRLIENGFDQERTVGWPVRGACGCGSHLKNKSLPISSQPPPPSTGTLDTRTDLAYSRYTEHFCYTLREKTRMHGWSNLRCVDTFVLKQMRKQIKQNYFSKAFLTVIKYGSAPIT